jgi:hypothetical protein
MLKVVFLFFRPADTWERIAQGRHGYIFILFFSLMPMIAVGAGVEAWGMFQWGKLQPRFGNTRIFTETTALHFGIFQAVLLLLIVLVSAFFLYLAAENFHGRRSYLQMLTLMNYGCGPIILMNALNALPMINPVIPWGIGFILTTSILYHGIPHVVKTLPTHAFGVYMSALFIILLDSGLATVMSGMWLLGYFDTQHSWLARHLQEWLQ